MTQSESLVPLSPEDIALLKRKGRPALGCAIVLVPVLAFITFFVIMVRLEGAALYGWTLDYILLAIAITVGGLMLLAALKRGRSLKTDIREGHKKVIIAPMESQRESTKQSGNILTRIIRAFLGVGILGVFFRNDGIHYDYYVRIAGKEYPVGMETYYKMRPGNLMEVQVAPHSNYLFKILSL